ncbi:uncharacterized protein LOC116300128 isoform X2 [Actinia tenebrosa]|uniref:Uncharacterized protein LOC116300128 isoform X2 n=1 Tax=Actinia tenebrosa TaxID=6105 RepID=A0A6P8IE02_ACTTE|nr:uncharacterized protein LOC116300128 isoform X2 [Actinia tenebrosa]
MYVISLSYVALILQLFPPVVPISSPGLLTREVGQDVVFMFNATNIEVVNWGIRDGNTNNLKQGLINYNIADGIQLDKKINSTSYAGRVSFVGDMSKGQAWFKITNLNINDTNQYMALIATQGASAPQPVPVQLTVTQPAPTKKPIRTSTTAITSFVSSTISSIAPRNITSSAPRNITSTTHSLPGTSITENQSKPNGTCTSIIAACVTIIVILVVVVVVLIVYIWKGKEKSARKRSLSSIKGENLEAYENANQMDDANIHKSAKPRIAEKEIYETICEKKDEGANTELAHHGIGALAVNEMTTINSSAPIARGQDPAHSLPQHYQGLSNVARTRQMPLYEPLNKRNTRQSTDAADNPRTYEQLQQNLTRREYQSLQITPNKGESKV